MGGAYLMSGHAKGYRRRDNANTVPAQRFPGHKKAPPEAGQAEQDLLRREIGVYIRASTRLRTFGSLL